MGRRRRRRLGAPLRLPRRAAGAARPSGAVAALSRFLFRSLAVSRATGLPGRRRSRAPPTARSWPDTRPWGCTCLRSRGPVLGSEKLAGAGDREQARSRALAGSLRASGRGGQPDGLHGAPGPGRSREPPPPRALGSWADLSVQGSGNRGSPGRFRTRLLGPRARSCDRPSPSLSSESTLDPRAF